MPTGIEEGLTLQIFGRAVAAALPFVGGRSFFGQITRGIATGQGPYSYLQPQPGAQPGAQPAPAASAAPFILGSVFYGTKGPKKRKRRAPRRAKQYPPGYQCTTDTDCEEYFRAIGRPIPEGALEPREAFVGPVPPVDIVVPGAVIVRSTVGVLSRVLGPLAWILFPSRTADDDILPQPAPQPAPRGPTKRPRIRVLEPPTLPGEAPVRIPGRYFPQPGDLPKPTTAPTPAPREQPRPQPRPGRWPTPRTWPAPTPMPTPRAPVPFDPLLPLILAPLLRPGARPTFRPGRIVAPDRVADPLTFAQPQPLPFNADRCTCAEDKPKRKRKGCKNPVTSKRTFSRGGSRFQTITRKLECPAQFREKR
jgi:hypothetical protein